MKSYVKKSTWEPRNWVEWGEKLQTFNVLLVQPPAFGQFCF